MAFDISFVVEEIMFQLVGVFFCPCLFFTLDHSLLFCRFDVSSDVGNMLLVRGDYMRSCVLLRD